MYTHTPVYMYIYIYIYIAVFSGLRASALPPRPRCPGGRARGAREPGWAIDITCVYICIYIYIYIYTYT